MERKNALIEGKFNTFQVAGIRNIQTIYEITPENDISFMEYFLELCDKNEDEFDIPHTKLIEYGVMTSTDSSKVKQKLDHLGFEIGVNYLLADVSEQDIIHGGSNKKVYKMNN